MTNPKSEKTAFVLAGGGSLGAIQVGMIKALADEGIQSHLLVGASVGAINAAYFAGDPTPAGAKDLENIWRRLRRKDVFRFSMIGSALGLLGRRTHVFNAKTFRRFLAGHLKYQSIEEAKIPLHIVASEIIGGGEVVLSKGSVLEAIQSSAAIPGVFPPVKYEGQLLLDGGIANHTPISTAIDLGADRLVVLPTGFTCSPDKPPCGALNMALHALNLIIARQLFADLNHFSSKVKISVIPSLCPQKTHPLDFDRTGELIDQGYEVASQWIRDGGIESELEFGFLNPHRH